MAGQSANLSVKEAKAMQMRVQHSGSQAKSGGVKSSSGDSTHRKMTKSMKSMKEDC
ncbi:MAG: hypothetical protein P4L77_12030 [Sulfuriferula sp.]|nr:hypothetical protein [Sulfuriferula sp.]